MIEDSILGHILVFLAMFIIFVIYELVREYLGLYND